MKPVVMKFGGTSVEDADAIHRTAKIVAGRVAHGAAAGGRGQRHGQSHRPAADAAAKPQAAATETSRLAISSRLRNRHLRHCRAASGNRHAPNRYIWIQQEFESIDELLRGLSAVGELTPSTNDMVVSFGERLSSRTGGRGFRRTRNRRRSCRCADLHRDRRPARQSNPDRMIDAERCASICSRWSMPGKVPVMGGFIGSTPEGVTTTLGRGGSDYTAALIGGGMDAEAIEIWTDVNGIMTADPRVCPDALRVKTISFEEAAELAYFGAKVLHPATILPAVQKNIPVLVLNSRNAENEGTRITALATHCRSPFKSIAAKRRLTIIDLVASRMLMSHGYLKAVFEVFDKHKCAVDMVSTSEVSVSLTVDSNEQLPEIGRRAEQAGGRDLRGTKGPDLHGRGEHPRPEWHRRPGFSSRSATLTCA